MMFLNMHKPFRETYHNVSSSGGKAFGVTTKVSVGILLLLIESDVPSFSTKAVLGPSPGSKGLPILSENYIKLRACKQK